MAGGEGQGFSFLLFSFKEQHGSKKLARVLEG